VDLFLEHVIPEIEESPAFKEGGLIDITFDEAYPPFTFSSDSLANATRVKAGASNSLEETDTAGENLFGRNVHFEPTGPNVPLKTNAAGEELYPGPGYNEYIDRPSDCVAQTAPSQSAETCLLGAAGHAPGARTDTATAGAESSTIDDNSISVLDEGRTVTGTGIPAGAYVGKVFATRVNATSESGTPGGIADTDAFQLVNSGGEAIFTTAAVSSVTLGAETSSTDPLFSADGQTIGGGQSGDVLISPYIRPGTVSDVYYNHYSTLRTLEDIFNVAPESPGLDGEGHIGYAAQPGLAAFGSDVFDHPRGFGGSGGWGGSGSGGWGGSGSGGWGGSH
jgi:Phosphoesterase family